jgi:hypothetical protein
MYARARKLIVRYVVCGLYVLLTLGSLSHVVAQAPGALPSDAYHFPVKPGTEAWNQLETHEDMLAVCQVPEDVLRTMSTKGLVETVLNYPLYIDTLLFNTPQQGFDRVAAGFNGLRELLNRTDAGTEIMARYRAMDPVAIDEHWTLLQKGEYALQFTNIEMLIAQEAILSKLTQAQRRALLAEALRKIHAQQSKADMYGVTVREYPALVLGRILQKDGPEAFREKIERDAELMQFLSEGTAGSSRILDSVVLEASSYRSSIAPGLPQTSALRVRGLAAPLQSRLLDYSTTIYTPRGTPVSAIYRTVLEWTPAEITAINNECATVYHPATVVRDASKRYNCHSYAWHSQDLPNNIWLNMPEQEKYWGDGSYVATAEVAWGYKVSYKSDDHSAIVSVPFPPYFRSKWGQGPVMHHAPGRCPYNAQSLVYYRRN